MYMCYIKQFRSEQVHYGDVVECDDDVVGDDDDETTKMCVYRWTV